jgi:hypothetical protein
MLTIYRAHRMSMRCASRQQCSWAVSHARHHYSRVSGVTRSPILRSSRPSAPPAPRSRRPNRPRRLERRPLRYRRRRRRSRRRRRPAARHQARARGWRRSTLQESHHRRPRCHRVVARRARLLPTPSSHHASHRPSSKLQPRTRCAAPRGTTAARRPCVGRASRHLLSAQESHKSVASSVTGLMGARSLGSRMSIGACGPARCASPRRTTATLEIPRHPHASGETRGSRRHYTAKGGVA